MSMPDHDPHLAEQPADEDAAQIVGQARRRALGGAPALRRASAVLWSSFLGAAVATPVLLLAPEDWTGPSPDLGRLTALFFVEWALMCIPAGLVCVLGVPTRKRHG